MRGPALLVGLATLGVVVGTGRVEAQNTLGAPTIGTIAVATNSLTVPWTAPTDNGGAAITAYDLRYTLTAADETDDANWTVNEDIWSTGGGTLSYELKDLEDGVGYDVEVRAENANGDIGPWSSTVAATTSDHGGTISSATDLTLGSSLAGHLTPASDEDVFEITLGGVGEVWIYAEGLLDTVGELLNSGGTVLEESDDGTLLDGPRGFEFREELEAGTYYVRVSSYKDREAGSYRIHAQTFTDPGSTFATATTVSLDSASPGRIGPRGGFPDGNPPGDADYFKLELSATTDVWVMAYGTTAEGDDVLDTLGALYDGNENLLTANDDSEFLDNDLGFMFRRSLPMGTYYIGVTGLSAEDIGPYTLHVRTATEPGETTATATPLTLRIPETGRISSTSDRDYFSLTLEEAKYVFIYALTFGSSLPLTPTILDDQGTEVSMHVIPHTNWREQGLFEYSFSVWGELGAGTYQIRIAPSGNTTGRYLLDPLVSSYNRMLEECTGLTTTQSDPWYGCQWHLSNTGQFTGGAMQDINVESVWISGNMGAGIHVAVVDDGLEADHVDLVDNVVAARNHDFTGQGGVYDPLETHGTAVVGLIAARDNDIGVRGVAPRASIFVYNLIARGSSLSDHEASAMYKSEDAEVTAVSNHSWGSPPDGLPIAARAAWERAVVRGVEEGYGGKGILYVLSGGNGHEDENNNSNLDGRANFYAVVAACAVGYDDRRSAYSELGANLWVCAPSNSGREELPGIATTHIPDRYRDNFGGTSSAAPIVSGVAALVRAANANLTWRDVKLILAASARTNDAANSGWEQGALQYGSTSNRYDFNHEYGFGMVDAAAAVALAPSWTPVPAMRTRGASTGELGDANFRGIFLPDHDGVTATTISNSLSLDAYVEFTEFVEIEVEFRHDWFRDLRIELESPSGTVSELSVPALSVGARSGHFIGSHRFGSAKHLGESAEGTWTLRLTDEQFGDSGRLMSWRLKVYGHGQNPGYVDIDDLRAGPGAATVTWKEPDDIGGSAVSSYDLRYRRVQDSDWTEVIGAGALDDRTHTLAGLDGSVGGVSVWYLVQIRAVNDAGPGPWSASSTVAPGRVPPDPPRSVRVAARNEALAVSWQTPNYWGAQPPVAYHIRYIEEDATDRADDEWTVVRNAWSSGGGELRYVIRGLENGTKYEVQVRAENIREAGDWSSVARGTPENINGPAEFAGTQTSRSIPENTAAGVDIGDPVAARDDEGDTLTHSLTSGAANFDIVSTSGQLQTKVALDRERVSSYSVTVDVHDGKASDGTPSTATDDTIRVTIAVEDVDEPPTVSGAEAPTVRENNSTVATYRAADPERATSTFIWSLGGADAGAFAISESGALSFSPAPDFEARADNTYEVTVRATDEDATDPGARTGELEVEVTVEDVDEPPEISGTAALIIAENSATRVGSYTAMDPEGTDTTWLTLTGTDARHFALDEFGTLSFVETPDFDRATNGNHGPEYRVTLRASDGGNRIGTYPVTVTLTNVPEGPLIEGDAGVNVNEGHSGVLDSYTKRDPEGSATNWGAVGSTSPLSGADADAFDFNQTTGRLTFKSPPDFEDGGGEYRVTVTANDGVLNGRLDVTVNVANLDERADQPVQLGAQRGVINVALTATLTDPDHVVSATWQWQRSTSRTGGWADIANADASSYTPTAADRDHYLRATASYEDGHGSGKSANAVTEFTTVNERSTNTAPVLPDSLDDIPIPENAAPGRNVGSPVRATDGENDPLVYALSGAPEFVIGRTTGQIRFAAGASFDYELGQRRYPLTVTADDGFGGTDTASVTVTIEDVNEAPVAVGDAPDVAEDGTIEIDVLANDSDPESGVLSLVGALADRPDHGTATVDTTTGRITYAPRANYHGADSFRYRVQDDGSPRLSSTATVSITVNPVNDDPVFASATAERSVAESAGDGDAVGAPVAATDIEDDTLSYSLLGAGAFAFEIDPDSGQITVASGVTFDASTQQTYEVTVETDDGNGGRASIDVTITVTSRPVQPPIIFVGTPGGGGPSGPSGPTPSEEDFEWNVDRDIEALDGGHEKPTGSWSDGVTLWLLDNPDGAGGAVYAYHLEGGERAPDREFDLDETNLAPHGVWSDGTTIWVSDSDQDRLFAHDVGTGERTPERDIELAGRNAYARGIWSDGETVWVLDGRRDALFAYDLESGEPLGECALDPANDDPRGIWSDRVTVWVSNHDPKRLFAYRLPAREELDAADDKALVRVPDEEFTELSKASNSSPRGLWSDGDVMYVADENDGKVYTYNMPDASDARLELLELSRAEFGEFSPLRDDYAAETIPDGNIATLTAIAAQDGASVEIEPADHDGDPENGYQVRLLPGLEIAITVTSVDGSRERVYRLLLGEEEEAGPAAGCLRGAVATGLSLVLFEGGGIEELEACAESRHVGALYALEGGAWVPYIIGVPEFVNRAFVELFSGGVPSGTALVVRSAGPPSENPAPAPLAEASEECLRGEVARGFSILVYRGGSVEELEGCARSTGVTTLYALDRGSWVPYIIGAPGFVNRSFRELFVDGVAVATPLVAGSK